MFNIIIFFEISEFSETMKFIVLKFLKFVVFQYEIRSFAIFKIRSIIYEILLMKFTWYEIIIGI